jgi:hypothetical protein
LKIAGCRLPIHGLTIGDCRFTLPIQIADWRLPIHNPIDIHQSNRQSSIQSTILNPIDNPQSTIPLICNLQSAIGNPVSIVRLKIADCRLPIHGLTIGDCGFTLPIQIADWRWPIHNPIGIRQSNRQSSIDNLVNLQSAICSLQSATRSASFD